MTADEWYESARKSLPRYQDLTLTALALGLCSEAGEVSGVVKKSLYEHKIPHDVYEQKLIEELGDVLWYMQGIADLLGVSLTEIASANIAKLTKRDSNAA